MKGALGDFVAKHKGNKQKAWDACDVPDYLFSMLESADYSNEKALNKYLFWCCNQHNLPNGKTLSQTALEDDPAAKLAMKQRDEKLPLVACKMVSKSMVFACRYAAGAKHAKKELPKLWKAVNTEVEKLEQEQAKQIKTFIKNPFIKKAKKQAESNDEPET